MIVAFLQLCLVVSVSVQVYGTDGVCKCSTSGEVMDCSYRNCLNFTDECPGNIKVLNMSGNGITELYNDYFTKCLLVNIKEVYLDNNNISKIAKYAFQGLDRVTTIDLSGNNISFSEDDLIHVSKLSLAGNPLKNFKIPENLKFLNLSSCQLQSGSNLLSYLNGNRKLTTLDLSSNNLTDWEEILEYVRPMTQLDSIYVADNPWVCNCPRDANDMEYMKTKVRGDEPKCGSPEVVSGSSLWNFTCPIPTTTTMANTITTTEPATISESTIPTNPTTIEDTTAYNNIDTTNQPRKEGLHEASVYTGITFFVVIILAALGVELHARVVKKRAGDNSLWWQDEDKVNGSAKYAYQNIFPDD